MWPVTPRGRISPTAQAHRAAHARLADRLGRPPTIREWATAARISYDAAKAMKSRWAHLGHPLAFTPAVVLDPMRREPCRPGLGRDPEPAPAASVRRRSYSPVPEIDALIREWRRARKRGAA
jgi:hypothetical protein